MEICFPINTRSFCSATHLQICRAGGLGRGAGGGGGPASCSFSGFLVWGNKALFYVEKGRDCERGLCQSLELRAQPPCFCFVHRCKYKYFFNLWSHFILVKFKYGQMSREVHSVVINRASNWLICHLEAVFVCLFTNWLPQDGEKTEKLNDARLWSGNPIIQNLQLLFQLQSFQTLAFSVTRQLLAVLLHFSHPSRAPDGSELYSYRLWKALTFFSLFFLVEGRLEHSVSCCGCCCFWWTLMHK